MKLLVRVVSVLGSVFVLFAVFLGASGLNTRPRRADLAIVFGNTVERTGQPSPRLRARLDAARQLYARGIIRRIFVSGGLGREGFDEALVMRRYLVSAGIPETLVVADPAGVNTAATCAHAHAYMAANGLRTADVVTQYFHVLRAEMACRRAGIIVVGAVAPRFFELRDLYSLARETIAYPVYMLGKG